MNLRKLIRTKLNKLNKEYNKIIKKSKYQSRLDKIEYIKKFIESIKLNEKELINYNSVDLKEIFKNIYKDNELDKTLEEFRLINIVLEGKYNIGLNIDLSEKQISIINKNIDKLENYIEKELSKIKEDKEEYETQKDSLDNLADDILELEYFWDKLGSSDKDIFTKEEFISFYRTIIEDENISFEDKRIALIELKKYNDSIINHKTNEIDKKKIEDLKKLFRLYGIDETIDKYIDMYITEVNAKADLSNIKEILEYLVYEDKEKNKYNIVNRFDLATLLGICLDGTKDSVKHTYKKIMEQGYYSDLFYETSGLWIDSISKDLTGRKKKSKSKTNKSRKKTINHEISLDELLENETFLKSLNLDVSIKENKNSKTLKTSNSRLKENYELLKLYGLITNKDLSKFPPSTFAFSNIDDKCDMYIELGLLNGEDGVLSKYVNNNPSCISFLNNDVYMLLYKLKRENNLSDYFEMIRSKHLNGALSTKLYKNKLGYPLKTKEQIEKFREENFIDQKEYIKNSEYYEEIILEELQIKYDTRVLEIKEIQDLENNNKVNEYSYKIGNQTISRLKALRTLTALIKKEVKIDKNEIMYCLTKNTYLDENTFDNIANTIGYNYKGELTDGILKKIQSN